MKNNKTNNRNSQKAISIKHKEISKKRITFFLVAIVAFLDAKSNSFDRGSLICGCRKYVYLVDTKTKATTLRTYVSNMKCYLGLNNKSFKANKIFYELVDLTLIFSIDELITIINEIKQLNDIDCLDYIKKELKR
jgi:hypothetical protein